MEKSVKLFDLTGKKAVVTGGSIGIGRGYATALAMAGADVAIVNRDEKTGAKTAAELAETYGVDSFCIPCDVTDPVQVNSMMDEAVKRLGKLDIAVNNAGIALLGADENVPGRLEKGHGRKRFRNVLLLSGGGKGLHPAEERRKDRKHSLYVGAYLQL